MMEGHSSASVEQPNSRCWADWMKDRMPYVSASIIKTHSWSLNFDADMKIQII